MSPVTQPVSVALLALSVFAGCGDDPPGVQGSPSDVKTAPGSHEGYEVITACQLRSIPYGVLGTGSAWYGGVAPEEPGRYDAVQEFAASVLTPAIRGVDSVYSVGVGTSCTQDLGASVRMSDWRQVDRVLQRSGEVLANAGLREEVSILVTVAFPD